jgi:hypothetical protein
VGVKPEVNTRSGSAPWRGGIVHVERFFSENDNAPVFERYFAGLIMAVTGVVFNG